MPPRRGRDSTGSSTYWFSAGAIGARPEAHAQAAQEAGLRAQADSHRQAALYGAAFHDRHLTCRHEQGPGWTIAGRIRVKSCDDESARCSASSQQDLPSISQHARRRSQQFRTSAPLDLPIDAADLQRRSGSAMAERRRSDVSSGRALPPFRADARWRDKSRGVLSNRGPERKTHFCPESYAAPYDNLRAPECGLALDRNDTSVMPNLTPGQGATPIWSASSFGHSLVTSSDNKPLSVIF